MSTLACICEHRRPVANHCEGLKRPDASRSSPPTSPRPRHTRAKFLATCRTSGPIEARASTRERHMFKADTHIADWLRLIRAEYLEIPGLCLTKPQVERLWGLDPVTSEALLSALVDVKFLRRTRQKAYVREGVD